MMQNYNFTSKYCIIKIEDELYKQKEGVIMGTSYAPSLANLIILLHYIRNDMYKCKEIKLNIRAIDDTLFICDNNKSKELFNKFSPKVLKFTMEEMMNNKIKFLDILLIKIKNRIEFVMQMKPLKTEFFIPYTSNHPLYTKIML